MQRNEKLMLIRDVPSAIIEALDGVMETQGMQRTVLREIEEDFTPLLTATGGPVVFVLSQPMDEWTVCFSSLGPDDEWMLTEAIAGALEQPLMYVLISDTNNMFAYRYFADGVLHEESVPNEAHEAEIDQAGLLARLADHAIPVALLDDRTDSFGDQHIVVGYSGGSAAHDELM